VQSNIDLGEMGDKSLVETHEAVAIVKTGERKSVLEEEIGHQSRGIAGYWVGRTEMKGRWPTIPAFMQMSPWCRRLVALSDEDGGSCSER
jgi:hypothetical protein